jgi:hypothetical protein
VFIEPRPALDVYVKGFGGFAIGNTYLQQAADVTQVGEEAGDRYNDVIRGARCQADARCLNVWCSWTFYNHAHGSEQQACSDSSTTRRKRGCRCRRYPPPGFT